MGRNFKDQGVLATIVGAQLDYMKQPLPLFGVWGNYNNSPYGLGVYDSDFQEVARTTSANYSMQGELWSYAAGVNYTTGLISSSTVTTNFAMSTCWGGVDGHPSLDCTPDGSFSAKNYDTMSQQLPYYGVVIGAEGYRQNFSLYQAGYTFQQNTRGGNMPLDQFTVSSTTATLANIATATTSGGGQIGYNRVTRQLVWLEPRDQSGSLYRAHIWTNPNRNLSGRFGELMRFITEAKAGTGGALYRYVDFTQANGAGVTEGNYRARVVPGNNGSIGISRFLEGTRIEYATLVPATTAPAADGLSTGTYSQKIQGPGTTTSYGWAQGYYYGMRHQMSWDNKWIIAFAPYYYYSCGIVAHIISVDDPSLYYTYIYAETSGGVQVLPCKQSGFVMGCSVNNSDGNSGMRTYYLDVGMGVSPTGVPLTPGQALNLVSGVGNIDTPYTSTNYPMLVPITRWSMPGGQS